MEILLAETLGLCFGVRRAIELAEAAPADGGEVNILGPLVHNHEEVARLAAAGLRTVASPDEVTGDTVVIRAHGVRPNVLEALRARGLRIVDATCPFVARSQQLAGDFSARGYTLVIIGHPDHPEVQGILGYSAGGGHVVSSLADVAALPADIMPGVIAQTTFPEDTFREIVDALAARYPRHRVRNTVCVATRERQKAARALAMRVEALYVIGGRHSSNANRLVEVCRRDCPRVFHIERADEIRPADLAGVARVGVTAGASTPDWLIHQVVERLKALAKDATACA